MEFRYGRDLRHRSALAGLLAIVLLQVLPICYAQNLGGQPATGQAVQGQTAAQPEGTVLNLVNWIGNVIAPVGAALAVVMAVVSYSQGRGVMRWSVTAGGLLVISGLTRLIEFWDPKRHRRRAVASTSSNPCATKYPAKCAPARQANRCHA
jgi:hypothetical protein